MTGDCHVQFGERLAGKFRRPTHLDFTVSISTQATRKQRSNCVKPFKEMIMNIPEKLIEFSILRDPKGSNQSKQYNSELQYRSLLDDTPGRILVEIGLREELLASPVKSKLQTVLLNPFNNQRIVQPFEFLTLSKHEAYAEKIRAALTRNRLAIRDFYDISYAIQNRIIQLDDDKLMLAVSQKMKLAKESPMFFDEMALNHLTRKIHAELAPTLRNEDVSTFDLNWVIAQLEMLTEKLFK